MLVPDIRPSELPFSLDLVERWLFWAVLSYLWSSVASIVGFSFLTLFVTSIIISGAAVFLLDRIKVDGKGKAVLITGCDTGFGNAVARKLHNLGFTVFACCLSKDSNGASKLAQEFSQRMHVVKMDVSSNEDVGKAMEQIKAKLDSDGCGLWAVITNAGLSTFGQVEWVPIDTYQKVMDVNLFGTVRTVKAALPLIRKFKGRVITVASMIARFGVPARSPYCATKYAVEGFTECLRPEMKKWGVKVICMEPGNFVAATEIFGGDAVKRQGEHMWSNLPETVRNDYGKENFDRVVDTMSYYAAHGETNIEPVINAMCDAVTHSYPQSRYQIFSLHEKIKCFVATHLPSIVFDYLYA